MHQHKQRTLGCLVDPLKAITRTSKVIVLLWVDIEYNHQVDHHEDTTDCCLEFNKDTHLLCENFLCFQNVFPTVLLLTTNNFCDLRMLLPLKPVVIRMRVEMEKCIKKKEYCTKIHDRWVKLRLSTPWSQTFCESHYEVY